MNRKDQSYKDQEIEMKRTQINKLTFDSIRKYS